MSMMKELPVDGERLPALVMNVFEYRRWVGQNGDRHREEKQATSRDDVPLWELVCAVPGRMADLVRVVLPAAERPSLSGGIRVVFDNLRVSLWVGKSGIDGRFWADGVEPTEALEASNKSVAAAVK